MNFYLVGKVINHANFWLYILSSPIQAKHYAYTLSVTGKNGTKLTYYDHVKTLDKKSCEITDKQLVFMIGIEAIKEMSKICYQSSRARPDWAYEFPDRTGPDTQICRTGPAGPD